MSPKSNSTDEPTKDLVNRDGSFTKLTEFATKEVDSVEAAIELFGEQGVAYSSGEEVTGDYQLVNKDEKQAFLTRVAGKRVFIVRWEFHDGDKGEFATLYCIIDGSGKFIVNDGAKGGIYGQLSKITSTRLESGVKGGNEMAGCLVNRGFRRNNDFYYRTGPEGHKDINKAIPRAQLNDVPNEHKKMAAPTWRLEF